MSAVVCSLALLVSCTEDPALPDNVVEFESNEIGLAANETSVTVNLKLVREVESESTVSMEIVPSGVTYGSDFTTEPAAVGNVITIPLPAGATTASFKINKVNKTGLKGDEKVVFNITSVGEGQVLGANNALTLSFAELLATEAVMEVNGGGATYPNRVFIDLSGNRQTAIARTSWDLAFSSTADEFRVVLNSANGMLARALDKTDLAAVTASDTVGFGAQLSLNAIFGLAASAEDPNALPDWVKNSTSWIDNPAGDLTKTAIAEVSATAAENKVYIIDRGTGVSNAPLGWKKIRVIRNGSNYTLQHADISSNTFTSIDITKNSDTRFQYVSFATGVVNVEPAKTKWDIAWTGFTNTTNFGPGTPSIPYYFQDVIITNTVGVQTAQVISATAGVTYDAFAEANLSTLTWSSSQIGIGSAWRTTGPPPSPVGPRTDRFYVVKDADGNYYKVQFTSLTTNGERGKPQFKFALVKKAG
jgi:hypothetical protein